jgi:hypothetical protein
MFQRANQKRGPKTRVGCFIKRCSTQQLLDPTNVVPLYIDSTRLLLNDDIALVNERGIKISNNGWDSAPYTDESWYILADVIRTTTSLEKLCFEKDAVIALQNDEVVEALAKNHTIKTLDLTGAGCGNTGAKAVAAILKENAAIEEVKFNANHISNEGAKAIADAVKYNFNLQTIDLGSNEIGAEGAKALAEALRENTTALRKLNIAYNNIGEGGGKHVLNALRQMKSSTKHSGPAIETIDVSGNRLTNETKQQIYQEVNRVQYRLSIVGANKGRAPAAGMNQRLNDVVREDSTPSSLAAANIRPMGRGRAATLPAWMTRQGGRMERNKMRRWDPETSTFESMAKEFSFQLHAPMVFLDNCYRQRNQASISKDSFYCHYVKVDGKKWVTASFADPATSEVFSSGLGRILNVAKKSGATLSTSLGEAEARYIDGKVYYTEQKFAMHAAAARAIDCYRYREETDNFPEKHQLCLEKPYLDTTERNSQHNDYDELLRRRGEVVVTETQDWQSNATFTSEVKAPTIHANNSSKVDAVAKEVQETTKEVQQANSDAVQEITVMEDKVKQLQSMYNAMENKVKQLQSTIAQQQDKLLQREEDIAQKDKEIDWHVQSNIVATETKKIKELQSTIAQQQAELAQRDEVIAQRDKEIATMRMERSQQLGEHRSRRAAQRVTIEKLHGKIEEQDKQIASMKTQRPQIVQESDEVESDDLETYTRCCVCLEPYEADPNSSGSQRLPIKSATCAHSLCEDCLGRYHASLMNGRSTVRYVRCPQCNDKTKKAFDIQNKVVDVFLREYIQFQCRKRKRLACV